MIAIIISMRNDDDNYDHNQNGICIYIIKRPHPGKPEGIPSKKVPKFTIPSLSSLTSFLISLSFS